jgi:xanthine dehydrogenase large subunit
MRSLAETPSDVSIAEPHESGLLHATGRALYVDDLPLPKDALFIAVKGSDITCGRLSGLDLEAVRASEGVVCVITASDIPGSNDVSPIYEGDLLFANDVISFHDQPIFAVAAKTQAQADAAIIKARLDYIEESPVLDCAGARQQGAHLRPPRAFRVGEPETTLNEASIRCQESLHIRGQEHFYLEGQVALALPIEGEGIEIWTSSQHPTEVQHLVASVLNVPFHRVTVQVRRMGGAFGGKESQAAALAAVAGLAAMITGRAVKYRMRRREDMTRTGKRHDFECHTALGIDDDGVIQAAVIELAARCGYSTDLSEGIVDRAMFHADNAYSLGSVSVRGEILATNTVSNTAFRGFGGPQGMLAMESMMETAARVRGDDPLAFRLRNLYRPGRETTPYGQSVGAHPLREIIESLAASAGYETRRKEISESNSTSSRVIKGLALTPVKFGISFTAKHLNQAGALINIYQDGSVQVNHGGTEMGQGLHTKIRAIVARTLGVPVDSVIVTPTNTDKVPNTSPTAASSGTDLNGMAAAMAAETLRTRLLDYAAASWGLASPTMIDGEVVVDGQSHSTFAALVDAAYRDRVSLSATGYYRTPKLDYDLDQRWGSPFFYYAYGAAMSEVHVDALTGEYHVERVDILHDVGHSLNKSVDQGQIEGGFVQGMGWLTTEELLWSDTGRLLSASPSTYKIPTAHDMPRVFNVAMYEKPNTAETIYRSKAVGEPPLMLAISVWCALKDACASLTDYRVSPPLAVPATPEQVLASMNWARSYDGD